MASDQEVSARKLAQITTRSFYSQECAVIVDQLSTRGAMATDELASRCGMQRKDLRIHMKILLEDQIVSLHLRLETREKALKASTRAYYYLDYAHLTDVIKWRMWKVQNAIDSRGRNELASQGYLCPTCGKVFSTLDASFLLDPMRGGLFCDVCDSEVGDKANDEETQGNKDRMRRLIEQTAKIRDLLKALDGQVMQRYDVAKWLEVNGPKPIAQAGPTTLRIRLAGDEDEETERARREALQAERRAQNQLPTWIAQSTVSGEISSLQLERDARLAAREGATDPVPTPLLPGALPTSPTRPERPAGAAGDAPRENGEAEDTLGDLSSYYANLNSVVAAAPPPPALDEASAFASVVGTTQVAGSDNEEDDDDDDDDDFDNEMEGIAAVTSRSAQQQPSASAADGVVDEAQNRGDKKRIRSPVNGVDEGPAALKKLKVDEVDGPSAGDGENPLVKVGDAMVPFLDVDEDVQNLMTPEEYEAYWEIYQKLS